jgi:hypothetical protein
LSGQELRKTQVGKRWPFALDLDCQSGVWKGSYRPQMMTVASGLICGPVGLQQLQCPPGYWITGASAPLYPPNPTAVFSWNFSTAEASVAIQDSGCLTLTATCLNQP